MLLHAAIDAAGALALRAVLLSTGWNATGKILKFRECCGHKRAQGCSWIKQEE
jgi:hypothetical protein